jgi:FPC/CPF motif-containing protein YcgG
MIKKTLVKFKEDSTSRKNKADFNKFILEKDHPCVMAKTVFSSKKYILRSYKNFGSDMAARKIFYDISLYLRNLKDISDGFYSFIAVFDDESNLNELQYEVLLWQQLQKIHNLDHTSWDSKVSSDPQADNFSFSILGQSFYIVGMHPNSSRDARKSPKPTLIFNLHSQFERLKDNNVYERVKKIIRERDKMKNGSVNPMMLDFGEKSEAPQYSGRKVEDNWVCPFSSKD